MSNEEYLNGIIAKVKKMNDGDDMGAEKDIKNAIKIIERSVMEHEDDNLFDMLYNLMDNDTKERLRSLEYNSCHCPYIPAFITTALVGYDGVHTMEDSEMWPVLVSEANVSIRVAIEDPHSLESIAETYNELMNKVLDYYEEIRDIYRDHRNMKTIIRLLKEENPDVDWDNLNPKQLIREIKGLGL